MYIIYGDFLYNLQRKVLFPYSFFFYTVLLFLSVTEHEDQSNLIVTFYFNFVTIYSEPQILKIVHSLFLVAQLPRKYNNTPGKIEKRVKAFSKDTFTPLRISSWK